MTDFYYELVYSSTENGLRLRSDVPMGAEIVDIIPHIKSERHQSAIGEILAQMERGGRILDPSILVCIVHVTVEDGREVGRRYWTGRRVSDYPEVYLLWGRS